MVTFSDIKNAQNLLSNVINKTPCDFSATYSNITGGDIFLKLENLQKTGSFKVRGAYSRISSLSDQEKEAGVISSSSGNHAQGVAYAASMCGTKATIIMPVFTSLNKVQAIRNYGAEVILNGQTFDESYSYAKELQKEKGSSLIHAFDDPMVIAGHGTLALEILERFPDIQAIVVPVGGGGLISGVAIAAKSVKPHVKIIGVQVAGSNAMKLSIEKDRLIELEYANSIADGISVRQVSENTFRVVKKYVDDIVIVDDEEITSVILMLLERSKLIVEGAGALALTAALYGKVSLQGLKTALIVSGGNIDISILTKIIDRGLIKSGRLVHIIVELYDAPGVLSKLTGIIGDMGVNIINVKHERHSLEMPLRQTKVELTLETRGFEHIEELLKALRAKGYNVATKAV